jgi:hypothetical protein
MCIYLKWRLLGLLSASYKSFIFVRVRMNVTKQLWDDQLNVVPGALVILTNCKFANGGGFENFIQTTDFTQV